MDYRLKTVVFMVKMRCFLVLSILHKMPALSSFFFCLALLIPQWPVSDVKCIQYLMNDNNKLFFLVVKTDWFPELVEKDSTGFFLKFVNYILLTYITYIFLSTWAFTIIYDPFELAAPCEIVKKEALSDDRQLA